MNNNKKSYKILKDKSLKNNLFKVKRKQYIKDLK